MSKDKKVVTINNEELLISQCRKFDAGYYKIGNPSEENSGDCYFIDNKYYRIETGQVVFDWEVQKYVLKTPNMINGVVALEEDSVKFGFFKATDDNIVVNIPEGTYFALKEEIFADSKLYRERMSNGEYYHIDRLDAREFTRLRKPDQSYKTSLPYDSRTVLKDYVNRYNKLKVVPNKFINNYADIIGGLTFGLEFETVEGFVPERILAKTGLIPLRDGSISGIEYVTVPMDGAKGLQTVVDACKVLKERTSYDETCALHLHLGGMPRTKEWILAFFRLTCHLQDSIFEMFPIYKKYNFGVKNKNYSKPYPIYELISLMDPSITSSNIDKNFDVLYTYLSMGQSFAQVGNSLDNIETHPADVNNSAKWNIRTRYYNHNLIPLIFGNKATVEFRIHTPTFEPNKVVPFIMLNAILVNFTTKYQDQILKDPRFMVQYNIKSVIGQIVRDYPRMNSINTLHESLLYYIDDRKKYTEDQNRKGLIKGKEDSIPKCRHIDWGYVKPLPKKVAVKSTPEESETTIPGSDTGLLSPDDINFISRYVRGETMSSRISRMKHEQDSLLKKKIEEYDAVMRQNELTPSSSNLGVFDPNRFIPRNDIEIKSKELKDLSADLLYGTSGRLKGSSRETISNDSRDIGTYIIQEMPINVGSMPDTANGTDKSNENKSSW